MLETRDLEFPDAKLTEIFKEATWILRSCLVSLKGDSHMVRIICTVWRTIITSVDLELINLNNKLENYEDRIWDLAAKKY